MRYIAIRIDMCRKERDRMRVKTMLTRHRNSCILERPRTCRYCMRALVGSERHFALFWVDTHEDGGGETAWERHAALR